MIVMINKMPIIIINVLMIVKTDYDYDNGNETILLIIIIIVSRWGWCQWTSIYGSDGPSQVR